MAWVPFLPLDLPILSKGIDGGGDPNGHPFPPFLGFIVTVSDGKRTGTHAWLNVVFLPPRPRRTGRKGIPRRLPTTTPGTNVCANQVGGAHSMHPSERKVGGSPRGDANGRPRKDPGRIDVRGGKGTNRSRSDEADA